MRRNCWNFRSHICDIEAKALLTLFVNDIFGREYFLADGSCP